MKNKNLIVALVGLVILSVLVLVIINGPFSQKKRLDTEPQTGLMGSLEDDETAESATLEFSIDRPDGDQSGSELQEDESTAPTDADTVENQAETLDQENEVKKEQYVFFYGETCPYCHDVIEWFDETGVESSLNIVRKEVYNDPANSQQMSLAAQVCGESGGGVPFLFTPDKQCIVGSTPIIDYLSEEAGL